MRRPRAQKLGRKLPGKVRDCRPAGTIDGATCGSRVGVDWTTMKLLRTLARWRSALALVGAVACGTSTTPQGNVDAGSPSVGAREPAVHRSRSVACPTDRPPGAPPSTAGSCAKDADCTQGKNGRCVAITAGPPSCTYDACATDQDCGANAGVCQCRAVSEGGANACRQGNCRVDGDCGGGKGFCSPSAVEVDVYCRAGIPAGSFGYFCHTAADECVSDSDCSDAAMGACVFDVDKARFRCRALLCSD